MEASSIAALRAAQRRAMPLLLIHKNVNLTLSLLASCRARLSALHSHIFIQPLLGTALAILLLGEQLLPTTIICGALILVSVYVISRQEKLGA